jgi:putative MFS transporter
MGHPVVFWIGMLVIGVGVGVAFREFLALRAATDGYRLTTPMSIGLGLDLLGTLLAAWGVLPRGWLAHWRHHREAEDAFLAQAAAPTEPAPSTALVAMDTAGLTSTHWGMLARMYLGLVIDTMKPATLGFVLPGMKAEYDLSPTIVSLFPMAALAGLTLGSVVFGLLGDIVGRRASFIFTALLFATTAPCGFMPDYPWHLVTCFAMGLAAGGELPLIYTMLAETMPARHRGWMAVAIGGIGGLSGYLVAAGLAAWLEPIFTWRILWFANLPTAVLTLAMLRWVPESPRFLLHMGFPEEARRVMAQVGVAHDGHGSAREPGERAAVGDLFRGRLRGVTVTLCVFGFAWGLCNWGFVTWLPVMLRDLGFEAGEASRLLAGSAFFAIPGTVVAAYAYGRWSSRWTATIAALATSGFLVAFWATAPILRGHTGLVVGLVVGLLVASNSMIGVLAPYSVELYPTPLRSAGSGVVAASSKSGGLVGPLVVGAILTATGSPAVPALAIGVPVGLAALLMGARGIETRGRTLEQLAALARGDG